MVSLTLVHNVFVTYICSWFLGYINVVINVILTFENNVALTFVNKVALTFVKNITLTFVSNVILMFALNVYCKLNYTSNVTFVFCYFFSSFHNKLFSVNVKQLYLFRFQTISSIQLQFIQYSLHIFHINSKHNIYVYAIIHVKQSHSYFRLVYILITIITVIIMIIIHALKLTLTTGRDLLETGIVGKIL